MAKNNDKNNNGMGNQTSYLDRIGQINENKRRAEIAEEAKKKKAEKEKNDLKPDAFNTMTSNLLKAAWENLVMSWGLTLIWIDIHVFGNLAFGNKLFCKLGNEWVPENVKLAHPKLAKKIGEKAEFWEGAGVACLNLGCLLIIIAVLFFIGIIFKIINHPLDALWAIPAATWKVLVIIFKSLS